ncbi:MAG: hypothetical protein CMF44_01600 [Legionellales bacterium]|jgi:putative endonuclease|nr:hypothetical protein [Legionellales bacterium]|tara:strand:+ start:222 stop:488 length:267 start_codon:yes stop_codon:yes gene_type:complete
MTWTVYVLECSDGTLYTGITKDLTRRLDAHQKGHGAKYTRGRGPFKIFYKEKCKNSSIARKREIEIKKMKRTQKFKLNCPYKTNLDSA